MLTHSLGPLSFPNVPGQRLFSVLLRRFSRAAMRAFFAARSRSRAASSRRVRMGWVRCSPSRAVQMSVRTLVSRLMGSRFLTSDQKRDRPVHCMPSRSTISRRVVRWDVPRLGRYQSRKSTLMSARSCSTWSGCFWMAQRIASLPPAVRPPSARPGGLLRSCRGWTCRRRGACRTGPGRGVRGGRRRSACSPCRS